LKPERSKLNGWSEIVAINHDAAAEDDLNAIRACIDTNPARWAEDADLALDYPVWETLT